MKKEKHHNEEVELTNEASVEETPQETTEQKAENEVENLENLKEKCADLADKNLRLMAEFDNYRKRTLKEKADLISSASERVLVNLLPLVDDFERAMKAMENTEDIDAIKEGEKLIYNKFIAFLQANGVKEIPTENEPFNVDIHEAVTTFPVDDEEKRGKIIDTVSKGYTLNDKVIRFPKVVVGE
ncbi:Protein GrpE [uncultured Paludibacter sp.]|nr:Protein GrpE [uncultured Paludibacter sp.]